jgi:hypothetical protein
MLLNTFVVAVATWFTPLIAARAIKHILDQILALFFAHQPLEFHI